MRSSACENDDRLSVGSFDSLHYRVSRIHTVARAVLTIGSVLVSGRVGTSGLAAAVLTFSLPISTWGLPDSAIEFLDAENMGVDKYTVTSVSTAKHD